MNRATDMNRSLPSQYRITYYRPSSLLAKYHIQQATLFKEWRGTHCVGPCAYPRTRGPDQRRV